MTGLLPPVWLLDVDGVVNVPRPGWGGAPRSGTAYADGYGYQMRWAPALVDRIRHLHSSGLVEVRTKYRSTVFASGVDRRVRGMVGLWA